MKLSIIIPGIRPHTWVSLYQSIPNVLSGVDYELIFVSPYDLPTELQNIENIRLIKDFGCPSRCNQLGLLHSRGEYVTWGADGGVFSPTLAIDKAFAARPQHDKGIVSLMYAEGISGQSHPRWWRMGCHHIIRNATYVPNEYFVVMQGLVRRDYLVEIGGWDCVFEHSGLGTVDLAVRLQNDGAEVVLGEKCQDYTTNKKERGRSPIKQAHRQDKNTFTAMYANPASANRTKIEFNNWEQVPPRWSRRFG